MEEPLPAEWLAIIERNVPYYHFLSPEERGRLAGLIQIFLDETLFEGVGGLELSDEIRVTIAAQACILLLGLDQEVFRDLRTVIVYPGSFIAPKQINYGSGFITSEAEAHVGESWSRGTVILSWDDVVQGASDVHDGHNVVFHEFAHQLDGEDGSTNGAPDLPKRSMYIAWARVLGNEYEELTESIRHHRHTFLDPYAGENPAEFFAVATEFFFEKPKQLLATHPELYDQLRAFFRRDPALMMRGAEPDPESEPESDGGH